MIASQEAQKNKRLALVVGLGAVKCAVALLGLWKVSQEEGFFEVKSDEPSDE